MFPLRLKLDTAWVLPALAIASTLSACRGGGGDDALVVDVSYSERTQQIHAVLNRPVADGETLHMRVRKGDVGELDCARHASELERIDGQPVEHTKAPTYAGPTVDPTIFDLVYDNSWLEGEPTAEMLARIEAGQDFIDICVMRDGKVVAEHEFHVRRALDQAGTNGKFDGEQEEFIASTEAYADLCVTELGEIPFFPRLADGDYGTFNCLDAEVLPTTVTDPGGNVSLPDTEVDQCDNPQYIYDLCEPNAVDGLTNGPRVTRAANEQGTEWVLLCRKAREEEGAYNDIAMIGHNPYTGKTCFFQNALYQRTDGLNVPHPGDRNDTPESPEMSPTLWSGIHGGLGSGIECADCHDADPFIHTPWIDQAKFDDGEGVVPKMGEHDAFILGFNDSPYSIVNRAGQGWTTHEQLVSPEANACTNCHRFGAGRFMQEWIDRLDGSDPDWVAITTESHRGFEDTYWMPSELGGITEETWPDSAYGRAMEFIRGCATNPDGCEWAPVPTDEIPVDNGLPVVDLEGDALALAALKSLGADVQDASCPGGECATRRCAECHPVSRGGISTWHALTELATDECRVLDDPEAMTASQARSVIDCLRTVPGDSSSVFAAERLGIMTTGVQYSHFRKLFERAYGDGWVAPYTQFKRRVEMPKGNHPNMTLLEYATLLKWFQNDLVGMNNVLDEDPPPQQCDEEFDFAALTAHIDTMRFEGWGAVNRDNNIRMFGCQSGGDDLDCFASGSFPNRSAAWGAGLGTVRELERLNFRTSFWTRTSADGRFVGNGGGSAGATISDLQTGLDIGVDASYDPGFFPDNSGFIFQGGPAGTGLCAQSLLESGDSLIDFSESQCMTASGINLYQHVARGLGGGDYFVINSQFTSDPGGGPDPSAFFPANATMKFTPMIFNGTTYDQMDAVIVDSPYEGDSVLSPSTELVVSRLAGPGGNGLGYVVRQVTATPSGSSYVVDTNRKLATVCMPGAKANISYDERFMVTHHYEGGTANIYLVDLSDGQEYRVTDMPSGTRALFPHFVSNGWIYFLVRDSNGAEIIAASDAALRVANGDGGGGGGGGEQWEGMDESGTVAAEQEHRFTAAGLEAGSYRFEMSGTNDADLYVRVGAAPSTSTYDCRPYTGSSNETCSVSLSTPGTIHVMVRGYSPSSDYTLRGREQ